MNAKVKGYFWGAIAAATYGTNPLFALPLYKDGMDPDSVLFFRYLFAIPILGMMIKGRGRSFKVERKAVAPLIVMGLLVAFSSLALFQSYNYMEVGIASTLLFVYPIMVALIMALVFKEKLTLQTVFCILLALAGIGLLYKSSDGTTLNLTGVLLVMASALSYAIYINRCEPVDTKNRSYTPTDFLHTTFRRIPVFSPCRIRERPLYRRQMVSLGKSDRTCRLSDRHLIPLYNQRCPIYRLDTDSHTGSTRTGHSCIFRGSCVRRSLDTKDRLRDIINHSCRDDHHCGQQYHKPFDPFQEALPSVADQKKTAKLILSI